MQRPLRLMAQVRVHLASPVYRQLVVGVAQKQGEESSCAASAEGSQAENLQGLPSVSRRRTKPILEIFLGEL